MYYYHSIIILFLISQLVSVTWLKSERMDVCTKTNEDPEDRTGFSRQAEQQTRWVCWESIVRFIFICSRPNKCEDCWFPSVLCGGALVTVTGWAGGRGVACRRSVWFSLCNAYTSLLAVIRFCVCTWTTSSHMCSRRRQKTISFTCI